MKKSTTSINSYNEDLKDGISVIIPTHKREKIITKCLNSLYKQTLSKDLFEVIIIINGEKDNTRSVINDFSQKTRMTNIKLLEIDKGSASLARNEGILYASRKYSIFVDDDDYISENYLEEMYRYADENTIVISQIVNVDENGKLNRNNTINLQIKQHENNLNNFLSLDKVATINACKLIPTHYLKNVQFDPCLKSGEDIVFFAELFIKYNFTFKVAPISDNVIYFRRLLPNTISRQKISFDFFVKQRLEVINKLNQLLITTNDVNSVKFIKLKIDAQFGFVNKYVLNNKNERDKVLNEIEKYNLNYVPHLINTNGVINQIKFIIKYINKPIRLIKLFFNK